MAKPEVYLKLAILVFIGAQTGAYIKSSVNHFSFHEHSKNINKLAIYCDPDLDCQAIGVANTNVSDPQNCHNYYVCITSGDSVQASDVSIPCPEGEYFNSITLVCEEEVVPCSNVKCTGDCSLACTGDLDLVGYPGDCTKYYICIAGGDEVEAQCPDEEPYFNGDNCTITAAGCCDYCDVVCTQAGTEIPDPYDCRKFYICLEEGVPTEDTHASCPANEVFDPFIGSCVSGTSCNPICTGSITTSPTTTTTTMKTTGAIFTETSTEYHTTTLPPGCDISLTCPDSGNFARCSFCFNSYFQCYQAGDSAEIVNCDPGMVFNPNPDYPFCLPLAECPYP